MSTNPYESPTVPAAKRDDQEMAERPAAEAAVITNLGREIFGAAVRLGGCWLILYCAWYLLYALSLTAAPLIRREAEPIEYVISGIGYGMAGIALIRFAPSIVRLCYASEAATQETLPASNDY